MVSCLVVECFGNECGVYFLGKLVDDVDDSDEKSSKARKKHYDQRSKPVSTLDADTEFYRFVFFVFVGEFSAIIDKQDGNDGCDRGDDSEFGVALEKEKDHQRPCKLSY